jgi:hypothetical protein
MKGKAIRHKIVNKTGASHVDTAKERAPSLTSTNEDLIPKRVTFVAALVPVESFRVGQTTDGRRQSWS